MIIGHYQNRDMLPDIPPQRSHGPLTPKLPES